MGTSPRPWYVGRGTRGYAELAWVDGWTSVWGLMATHELRLLSAVLIVLAACLRFLLQIRDILDRLHSVMMIIVGYKTSSGAHSIDNSHVDMVLFAIAGFSLLQVFWGHSLEEAASVYSNSTFGDP
mmetsp:Transcript_23158/g.43201  ORF Transcript_23158/g.43201 Transcript_23158/m.43201 type:complete len:126 (+) Transcript_23158:268-645(+)